MQQNINANTQLSDQDANNDGKLSCYELAQACNITVEEAQQCISQYDQDGDQMLDAEEFNNLKEQILEQQRLAMTDKLNMNDMHDAIDADGDGQLSAQELADACSIPLEDAQNIILQYDADGDGLLNPTEFEDLKQQVLSQQRDQMTDKLGANDDLNNIDANNDGQLSKSELAVACNITEKEAENIIMQYDDNGDGLLNPEEFENLKQQILSQQREKASSGIVADSFSEIDDNKDGKLSALELSQACNISLKEAELLIQQNDVNGDGLLDENEFNALKEKILKEQKEKERIEELKKQRQQRQQQTDNQYNQNNYNQNNQNNNSSPFGSAALANDNQNKPQSNNNNNNNNNNEQPNDDSKNFKHKWKLGMNFDPKNNQIVLYVSDEITGKNWGISLTKDDFPNGEGIRKEYRKLGGCISGKIDYKYPDDDNDNSPLNIIITKEDKRYEYDMQQQ